MTMSNWRQRLTEAVEAGRVLADSEKNIDLLLGGTSDERAEGAIAELVDEEQWEEVNDRFYKTLAFGTGGLRGRTIGKIVTSVERGTGGAGDRPEFPCYGTACMNFYNVNRAIRGLISYVKRHLAESGEDRKPVVVIAHDTRHFSAEFTRYCGAVCVEVGCDVHTFEGPRATPELSFALRMLRPLIKCPHHCGRQTPIGQISLCIRNCHIGENVLHPFFCWFTIERFNNTIFMCRIITMYL